MRVHRPGLPWLIALAVIPLLLAAIGYGTSLRPPSAALPGAPAKTTGAPAFSLAAFAMTRAGNTVTLTGDFPDATAKAALVEALDGALPPGVTVSDQIQLNPDVDALDFAKAKPLFADSASIDDFALTVNADTITLAGTAASPQQKGAVDADARRIWSHLNVVDNLAVGAPAPPAAASPPAAPACAGLQAAIDAATGGPITFGNDGAGLTPADDRGLTQVATELKACPSAHVSITGYTDNWGSDRVNLPLSGQRAQAVATFLTAQGVSGGQLTVKGLGSANPVAANDTPGGRAKNRRVEIVVG